MTTTAKPAVNTNSSFVLDDVSWDFYLRTSQELEASGQHVRVTYDRGRMELRSPTFRHEWVKKTIARLIEAYADESGTPTYGGGSVTCRREDLNRGLEPDECYFVGKPPRNLNELDLSIDPPPDLVIEIDISPSKTDRESIYAEMGVREVWRYRNGQLTSLHLGSDGQYHESSVTLAFPELPLAQFSRFLSDALTSDQFAVIQEFRRWAKTLRSAE